MKYSFTTLLVVAFLFSVLTPQKATARPLRPTEKNILLQAGDSIFPTAATITNFAGRMGLARRPTGGIVQRQLCLSVGTDGNSISYLYTVDTNEGLILFDKLTALDNSELTMRIGFSCSIGESYAAFSGILSDFTTQAHVSQALLPSGAPDGAPRKIISTGEPLPGGANLAFASTGVVVGNTVVFRNDILGIFAYDIDPGQFRTVADSSTNYPGTNNGASNFSLPAASASTIGFRADGDGGENGALAWDVATGQLEEAVDFMGAGQAPLVTDVKGAPNFVWLQSLPPAFVQTVVRSDGNETTVLAAPGSTLDNGDMLTQISQFFAATSAAYSGPGASDDGLCAYFNATVASDPFGNQRLIRTCQGPAPAEPESDIILSPNEIIDGETIVSWDVSSEAADNFDVAILVQLIGSGPAVVFIGDPPVVDTDGDGVNDSEDVCTSIADPDQRDTDGDNIGNHCDPDVAVPNDCQVNFLDLNVYKNNFFVAGDLDTDNNGDGQTNFLDLNVVKSHFFGKPGPSANGCN